MTGGPRPDAVVRVLAFVEARGVTGALRNLLDFAALAAHRTPRLAFDLATYWRSTPPGFRASSTADIEAAIDAARRAGIHTHLLHERFPGDPRLFAQVRALFRTAAADVIETHHVKSHFLVAACSDAAAARRWLAFHHGYTATSPRTRAYNLLDVWSLRRPAAIVTPCRAFAAQLVRRGIDPSRVTVIHSAVSAAAGAESPAVDVRAALGLPATNRIVLAVGRLSREKAHAVLIAAFARNPLARANNAALVIAGDGPERSRLAAAAERLGVGRIHLVGHQTDVWPYYHAADVVALPSDSEGSPIALLEAMAAAKPVVATHVGGVPEIVESGRSGLLVPPRNPEALAEALATILENPALAAQLGAEARRTVRQRFTHEVRAEALATVYNRLIAHPVFLPRG